VVFREGQEESAMALSSWLESQFKNLHHEPKVFGGSSLRYSRQPLSALQVLQCFSNGVWSGAGTFQQKLLASKAR